MKLPHKMPLLALALGLLGSGCGEGTEEALQAHTTEESASDLITFFDGADPNLKQLAKTTSEALDKSNFLLAIQCISQLKANAAKLSEDQFMVVTEAGMNVQNALTVAADNGDKNAQQLLNLLIAGRRN
jgi:hypothetical protein